ncbi:Transposon Ty3-G Gag-Pol polyprotein [Dictyocoela muelleri]|nr:Transposon Ty3-G Gag-Pol polyprotein [Dictyocoela muelleri]
MSKLLDHFDLVKIFMDDILIHSHSYEEHVTHLKSIFEIFQKNNVKVNFRKSKFGKETVNYLGNIISKEGIKPDISRVLSIETIKIPKTINQLQKLLGIINWFRPYVFDISRRIAY